MNRPPLFAVSFGAALVLASIAQAGTYQVTTLVDLSGMSGLFQYTQAYNGPNNANLYPALSSTVGYGFAGGCGTDPNCAITASGTTDATGLLTAAFDNASLSGTHCVGGGIPPTCGTATADAYAFGNLATGSVGVSADGNFLPLLGTGEGGFGYSLAQIGDTLNFTVAGAGANTVTDIPVTFTVNGALTADGNLSGFSELDAFLAFGNASLQRTTDWNNASPVVSQSAGGWSTFTFNPNTAGGGFTFSGIYQLTGASSSLAVGEALVCQGTAGYACDAAHTGVISLDLPNNVSFTSDSGVFLTQPGTAAPEPASLLLAGLGLTAFGTWRRKRRKH